MRPAQIVDHRSLTFVAEGQTLDDVRPTRRLGVMSKWIHNDEACFKKGKSPPQPMDTTAWAHLLRLIPCASSRNAPAA
jgi:hypothetical protein